jgi:oligopeptide transport system ATP-binding protein
VNGGRPLLEVEDLRVHFLARSGLLRRVVDHVKAVDGVSFVIPEGSTMGLVGESGSGKTTIGRAIARLVPIMTGSVRYRGERISGLSRGAFMPWRRKIATIFQDPFNSLNPRMTIAEIIAEPLEIHCPDWTGQRRTERCRELLQRVSLDARHLERYPHEFSGGQRQRIGIARALAAQPEFVICDEPVSALDVSVQAQIVNLLQDLQEELGLTYLFIAHDLAVVEHISDQVLVMTEGRIVEQASAEDIYSNPRHEYTRRLLAAVPTL